MNVALAEIGWYILADPFLCPKTSDSEPPATERPIRQMVDCLATHHGTVTVGTLSYGAVYYAIDGVLERNRHWFSIPDQLKIQEGLSSLKPVARKYPRRLLGS